MRRGVQVHFYAVWWIRQSILQALAEQSRTVRLPLNKIGLLYKISKASRLLQQERSDAPKAEDIAKELDVPVEEVRETLLSGRSMRSLDATFKEEEDHSLLDILADDARSHLKIRSCVVVFVARSIRHWARL